MPGCLAVSKSTGRPCGNAALAGLELCEFHHSARERGEIVALQAAPRGEGVPPGGEGDGRADREPGGIPSPALSSSPAPDLEGAELPPEAAALEEAPALDDEAAAQPDRAAPPDPAELANLDALAAAFGWTAEPAATDAPRLEAAGADPGPIEAAAAAVAGPWTPERAELVIRWASAVVERTGKPPLSAAEIREGGRVMAPVFDRIFRFDPHNPYAVAGLWIATTFGVRYWEEIAAGVVRLVRWIAGRIRGERSPARARPRRVELAGEPERERIDPAAVAWGQFLAEDA